MGNCFVSREISQIKFNERVIEEAACQQTPLVDRLKFLSIYNSNMDEFYMVRVGKLAARLRKCRKKSLAGNEAAERERVAIIRLLSEIYRETEAANEQAAAAYREILEAFSKHEIFFCKPEALTEGELKKLKDFFKEEVFPVLSQVFVKDNLSFPHLDNCKRYLMADLSTPADEMFGIVGVPDFLDNAHTIKSGNATKIVLMEDILLYFLPRVFPLSRVANAALIRLTRNGDLDPDEAMESSNYPARLSSLLLKRNKQVPVRLEYRGKLSNGMRRFLLTNTDFFGQGIFHVHTPFDFSFIATLEHLIDFAEQLTKKEGKERPQILQELTSVSYRPAYPAVYKNAESILDLASKRDLLFSFPFESADPFLRLLDEAADRADVLSIKTTLYRVSKNNSRVVDALCRAAENGKNVTVVIELKARFDEANNISVSSRLQKAGCLVQFGMPYFKIHSKILLIEKSGATRSRFVTLLGTGNFNEETARVYTDLHVVTADRVIAEDAKKFFHAIATERTDVQYAKMLVSPTTFRQTMVQKIDEEIEKSKEGKPCRIVMKTNGLNHPEIMEKLIEASNAGVPISLIVRGVCCLLPNIPEKTENIRIISVVGKFLEHSRIYLFGCGNERSVYIASGDMMVRNLDKRFEICYQVRRKHIADRIERLLKIYLCDNVKARELQADGSYVLRTPNGEIPLCAQEELVAEAKRSAIKKK